MELSHDFVTNVRRNDLAGLEETWGTEHLGKKDTKVGVRD